MNEEIKVTVVEFADRKCFQMQYRDPLTGRKKTRATKTERDGSKKSRREAERAAGELEKQLREGTYAPPSRISWGDFRQRYEDEVLTSLAEATHHKVVGVFNKIERHVSPGKLADLTATRISAYQSKLREDGASESTIKCHLAHLKAALGWAKRMGLLAGVPAIETPRRAKGGKVMKGRPISGEEFDRMLFRVYPVLGTADKPADPATVESWRHFLRGLWASGLRLGESLQLSWDRDDKLRVDLSGKRPMLRIPAALEKGNKDRLLPMAPEFAEFLLATPEAERKGYVFKPGVRRNGVARLSEGAVSRIISAIGEVAGVKVNTNPRTGVIKYASAHDLRRSFGERWARLVMPQVLMELMRHESIDTTMRFYVGRNAQTTADILWKAHEAQQATSSNTTGNTTPNEASNSGGDESPVKAVKSPNSNELQA